MTPLLLKPIYKTMIWGGDKLKTLYGRDIPDDHTGESWDVSCREKEMSVIRSGVHKGETLQSLIDSDRVGILGGRVAGNPEFPLLFKTIDARDDLSIQVHPDDRYAQEVEHLPYGKTETWYILDAPKNAKLLIGMADFVTREQLEIALKNNDSVVDCFGELPVVPGDVVHIPAGMAHAITRGVMLMEIQQNSDTTYRVYDYNRPGLDGLPRELHISKALAVIDFDGKLKKRVTRGLSVQNGGFTTTYAVANRFYAIEIISTEAAGVMSRLTDGGTFEVLSCVSGKASVCGGGETVNLSVGDSVFLPANVGEYSIAVQSSAKLLRTFVPDIQQDFIAPLKRGGFSQEDIETSCAI